MATTATETVRTIVNDALLDIEAGTLGQTAEATAMAHGIRHLNRLMKSWQSQGYLQSLVSQQSLTLVADTAAHTMSPVRPAKILNVRYKDSSGTELPMNEMSRQEYDELPIKTSQGIPTNFYYDKQKEAAVINFWPVIASVTTETAEITYEREYEDISDEDDTIDIPVEAYDAVILHLGKRLTHTYGSAERKMAIRADAKEAFDCWLASDVESIVRFYDGF